MVVEKRKWKCSFCLAHDGLSSSPPKISQVIMLITDNINLFGVYLNRRTLVVHFLLSSRNHHNSGV